MILILKFKCPLVLYLVFHGNKSNGLTVELLNQKSCSRGVTIHFRNVEESKDFHSAFEQRKNEVVQGSVYEICF